MTDPALTPQLCRELAEILEGSLRQLRGWQVSVPIGGRLDRAAKILRDVGSRNAFPRDGMHLRLLAHAARQAEEYSRIVEAINRRPTAALRHDIERSVRGELGGTTLATRTSIQYQTQLYVGAMVAHAGTVPIVPDGASHQTPDFEVENGTLRYAIEVKRPLTHLRPGRLVSDAARQLAASRYHGGALVVDFTDCMPEEGLYFREDGPLDMGFGMDRFIECANAVEAEVFDEDRRRLAPRRSQIFALISLVQVMAWSDADPDRLIAFKRVRPAFFWRRQRNTLRHRRARWLFELLERGLLETGHDPNLLPST